MNRSFKHRVTQATMAAFVVSLSFASAAMAAPTATVTGTTADYVDQGGTNTDVVTVAITASSMSSVTYQFDSNANIAATIPCVPTGDLTVVNCVVPNGSGVTLDLNASPGGAIQTATLLPAGGANLTWDGQISTLTGGATADQLTGAEGADTFVGEAGADGFDGGGGINDTVSYAGETAAVAAQIDDKADSGVGCPATCENDTITLTIENLTGGSGADTLVGNASANILSGGGGNDLLFGLAGIDTLLGQANDDTYYGGAGADLINMSGDGGTDTLDYSADGRTTGVDVNLHTNVQREGAGGSGPTEDTFASIENATGTLFADSFTGSTAANTLRGGASDDTFRGEGAAGTAAGDVIFGQDGAGDTFTYNDGAHDVGVTASLDDVANDGLADADGAGIGTAGELDNIHSDVENIVGTVGNDKLIGSASRNIFDGVSGSDDWGSFFNRVEGVTASPSGGGPEGDIFSNMDNVEGGKGNDILVGDAAANDLKGNEGNDTFRGGLGDDTFDGDAGSNTADYSQDGRSGGMEVVLPSTAKPVGNPGAEDTFVGGEIQNAIGTANDDILTGDTQANSLSGGGGLDTLTGSAGDDTLDPGTGSDGGSDGKADVVSGGLGTDVVTYAARTQAVNVSLDGSDNDGATGEGDNVSSTTEGVIGGSGNDTLIADTTPTNLNQPNTFDGGGGDDTITGLAGNDVLTGGSGKDAVSGGDDNDTIRIVDGIADSQTSCGGGNDTVDADDIDPLDADCETVTRTATPVPVDETPPGPTPGPAASTITIDNPTVKEGNSGTTNLVFTVTMTPAQPGVVAVPWQTLDVTAKAGEDYTAAANTVTFAAGETTKTLLVAIKGDTALEKDEAVGVGLTKPTGNANLTATNYGVGTIVNDDTAAAAVVRKTPRLTSKVTPRRDRRRPFRFVVTGRLLRPTGIGSTKGCNGKVRVQLRRGTRLLKTRTGFIDSRCTYTVPLTTKRKGIHRVSVRFLGNKVLKPRLATTKRVRAG